MEGYAADPTDDVAVDLIDWRERRYFGKNTVQVVGLSLLNEDGVTPLDADGPVTFTYFKNNADGTSSQIFSRTATHTATGLYEITIDTGETDDVGNYYGTWAYTMNAQAETYTVYMVVGESNPDYDRLRSDFKEVVDNVWIRFADLFDSPSGGPHLQTYYQAHWSRGRMAQLMGMALRRLNVISQPYQTYTLDGIGGSIYPVATWGGLLESATYIEALKHLRRSYLEQPQFMGNITRLDRTNYFDRWGMLIDAEQADIKSMQDTFKISNMMMGVPQVLVSGGVYGRYGPTRIAGSVAARPRYWTRFYS